MMAAFMSLPTPPAVSLRVPTFDALFSRLSDFFSPFSFGPEVSGRPPASCLTLLHIVPDLPSSFAPALLPVISSLFEVTAGFGVAFPPPDRAGPLCGLGTKQLRN